MAGISTGTGIFSGVDSASLIDQLMTIEARPKTLIQKRVQGLQIRQAAYLDLNSRLSSLKSAASSFRLNKTFQTKKATSSDEDILTATASTSATAGSYTFVVDRLVSSQQLLSTGFANRNAAAVGATSITFESTQARLDRDVNLSELNGGAGVSRGKILITDSANVTATIDLSRATTVNEVLQAINTNGTAHVTASVQGGSFVIKDTAGGGGAVTIANAAGSTTANSLGIAVSGADGGVTGTPVYRLSGGTPLSALNDGNGVLIKTITGVGGYSFALDVGGTSVHVNLGAVYTQPPGGTLTQTEGAVTTVDGAINRINAALTSAGVTGVTASVDSASGRLLINDTGGRTLTITENGSTTAHDLGLPTTPATGAITGQRIFAGLNTTLATGLNGGHGIGGDGNLSFTARDGFAFSVHIDGTASLTDIFAQIQTASGVGSNGKPRISIALDQKGTGFVVTDNTAGTTSNLIITGTDGDDSAAGLNISTGAAGVASSTRASGNLQRQYLSRATNVNTLNGGRGIGTGKFRITDSFGATTVIDIGSDTQTVADLIDEINGVPNMKVKARINAHGDGIEIVEDTGTGPAGANKIKIEDVNGTVAKSLSIAGQAAGTGAANKIDGTAEKVVTLTAADTLQTITDKINAAKVGATASIISDGSAQTPFHLNLSSNATGEAGRLIVDSLGADFGFSTLDIGQNSRVFFGSSDPARGIAVTSSTNTVDGLVPGVTVDLKQTGTAPVQLNVATDTEAVVGGINDFIKAFNTAIDRITTQTKYDAESEKGGPLLGDTSTLNLRTALYNTLDSAATNITSRYDQLSEIGIKVGAGGKLSLDEEKFRAAYTADPAGIEELFAARVSVDDSEIDLGHGSSVHNPNAGHTFSSLGVMGQFEEMIDKFIDSSTGVLTRQNHSIDDEIKLQNDRITALDSRLEQKRALLQRQFLAMEQAIGALQSQSSALSQIKKAS